MTLIQEVKARGELPSPATARRIRQAAGVSQARVAQELGVARITVSRWERGQRLPQGSNLMAYATLLRDLVGALEAVAR